MNCGDIGKLVPRSSRVRRTDEYTKASSGFAPREAGFVCFIIAHKDWIVRAERS